MGLLFTTEGTRRVIDTLNTAFDGPNKGLQYIRDNLPSRPFYNQVRNKNWQPGKLARMLMLLPFDQGPPVGGKLGPLTRDDRKRWIWFLKNVIGPQSSPNFDNVFVPLRNALAEAILNRNIVRVAFDHVEVDTLANVVIFDAPFGSLAGEIVRHITLFTAVIPANVSDDFGPDVDPPLGPPWRTSNPDPP